MGTVYRLKDKANKQEMPRCQRLYPIVWKISLLAYELGLPVDNCIHPVISIAYLIRYYANDDPYNYILLLSGPMEYKTESDSILDDDERDGKC